MQLSVQLLDANGDSIGLDGCPLSGGYATVISLNDDLDGLGTNSATGNTKSWSVSGLPANAATANIEVYPKSPSGTDTTRYGRSLRRSVPIPATSVDVVLPLNCGFSDNGVSGKNGSIAGFISKDGHGVDAHRVSAFSLSADTEAYPLGFGIDSEIIDGVFSIDSLAPDQPYIVFMKTTPTAPRIEVWWVRVQDCKATVLDFVEGKFQDVPGSHPFFDEVTWMLDEGLTTGYSGDLFKPGEDVSRQAVSAWLFRLNAEPNGPFPDTGLTDVTGSPFEHEIEWMVHTSRADGFDDGTFKPLRCVSRQAMVAFLHREEGAPPGPFAPLTFSDVPPDNPFVTEIAWAVEAGVTQGYEDGTFRPGDCVTRQAASAFLYRTFGPPG